MVNLVKVVKYTGLLFQLAGKRTNEYTDDELWMMCKKECLTKMVFPYIIEMPCGAVQRIKDVWMIENLPNEDMPCPCGDPNHHIIRFQDNRDEPKEENQ